MGRWAEEISGICANSSVLMFRSSLQDLLVLHYDGTRRVSCMAVDGKMREIFWEPYGPGLWRVWLKQPEVQDA